MSHQPWRLLSSSESQSRFHKIIALNLFSQREQIDVSNNNKDLNEFDKKIARDQEVHESRHESLIFLLSTINDSSIALHFENRLIALTR